MPIQFIDIENSHLRYITKEDDPIEIINTENANLLFQNVLQDLSIQTLQDENSELMFRLASLEMGGL